MASWRQNAFEPRLKRFAGWYFRERRCVSGRVNCAADENSTHYIWCVMRLQATTGSVQRIFDDFLKNLSTGQSTLCLVTKISGQVRIVACAGRVDFQTGYAVPDLPQTEAEQVGCQRSIEPCCPQCPYQDLAFFGIQVVL